MKALWLFSMKFVVGVLQLTAMGVSIVLLGLAGALWTAGTLDGGGQHLSRLNLLVKYQDGVLRKTFQ